MITVSAVSAGQLKEYYEGEDYYFQNKEGEVIEGKEIAGAEKLGAGDLQKILQQRENVTENSRAAIDLTFSAPKSVSLVSFFGDKDDRIAAKEAHDQAVKTVLEHIKNNNIIHTRDEEGKLAKINQDSLVAVKIDHALSRLKDPQLHSHVLVANVAEREKDGQKTALEPGELMRDQKKLGLLYRQELAHQLEQKGFSITWDKEKLSFEINGISQQQIDFFSKRREEILSHLRENGLQDTTRAKQIANLETRDPKEKNVDLRQLRAELEQQAKEAGLDLSNIRSTRSTNKEPQQENNPINSDIKNLDRQMVVEHAVREVAMRQIVLKRNEFQYEVANYLAQHGFTASIREITGRTQQAIGHLEKQLGILSSYIKDDAGHSLVGFRKIVEASAKVEMVGVRDDAGPQIEKTKISDTLTAALERFQQEKGFKPDQEQIDAATNILTSNGDCFVLGKAGTGKTTMLSLMKEMADNLNIKILGTSFTGKAVDGMAEAGIAAKTIDSLAAKADKIQADIIIVDEANMTDSIRMATVQEIAQKTDAKIVWMGDPNQLQAIGQGKGFQNLLREAYAKDRVFTLENIRRQEDENLRAAVQEFAKLNASKGIEMLQEQKRIINVRPGENSLEESINKAATYYAIWTKYGQKNALALTTNNKTVNQLNQAIRNKLFQLKHLDKNQTFDVQLDKNTTINLALNEKIMFTRNDSKIGVRNGEFGKIVGFETNQETGTVDKIKVETKEGIKTIDIKEYNHINYGYAVTIHKSEGMTVGKAVFVHSEKDYVNANLLYVAASRASEEFKLITDCVSKLAEANKEWKQDILDKILQNAEKNLALGNSKVGEYLKAKEELEKFKENKNLLIWGQNKEGQDVFLSSRSEVKEIAQKMGLSLSEKEVKAVLDIHLKNKEINDRFNKGQEIKNKIFEQIKQINHDRRDGVCQ
ncbi:MAG: MobF family relaxase [Desulfonauticus sp.]|nr:MobF family relaxase [Desulfonauticus sp.]